MFLATAWCLKSQRLTHQRCAALRSIPLIMTTDTGGVRADRQLPRRCVRNRPVPYPARRGGGGSLHTDPIHRLLIHVFQKFIKFFWHAISYRVKSARPDCAHCDTELRRDAYAAYIVTIEPRLSTAAQLRYRGLQPELPPCRRVAANQEPESESSRW